MVRQRLAHRLDDIHYGGNHCHTIFHLVVAVGKAEFDSFLLLLLRDVELARQISGYFACEGKVSGLCWIARLWGSQRVLRDRLECLVYFGIVSRLCRRGRSLGLNRSRQVTQESTEGKEVHRNRSHSMRLGQAARRAHLVCLILQLLVRRWRLIDVRRGRLFEVLFSEVLDSLG